MTTIDSAEVYRGSVFVMAFDAIKLLNQKKHNGIHIENGFVEWKLKQQESN